MQDLRLRCTALCIAQRRLWGVGGVILLGVFAASCSHEVVAVGSCSIHSDEAGQPILECPDGSRRNLATQLKGDGVCSVVTDKDGVVQMTCSDGRSHSFDGKIAPLENSEGCEILVNADGGRELICGDHEEVLSTGCADGFPGNVRLAGLDTLFFGEQGDPPPKPGGERVSPEELASFYLFRLSGCRTINGDLLVSSWDDERLPVSLELLESVGGDLVILGNAALKQIDFSSLSEVGGEISVVENDALTSLGWRDELSAGKDVYIGSNPALRSCDVDLLLARTNVAGQTTNIGNSEEVCP